MGLRRRFVLIVAMIAVAGISHGVDNVEIVLDSSMEMWELFSQNTPRIAAVRSSIDAFVNSPSILGSEIEIGLRTIGGRHEIVEESGCRDSIKLIQPGIVDPAAWSAALAELDPQGGRPLVAAIEMAVDDLAEKDGNRRIVVITSGVDQCQRDIVTLLEQLKTEDNPISVRLIGLGLDHALASSLVSSAPTRNVSDPVKLYESLRWAVLPEGLLKARPEWLEVQLSRGGEPIDEGALILTDSVRETEITADIEKGKARVRAQPGRLGLTIESVAFNPVAIAGLVFRESADAHALDLSVSPPVTLEVSPERPDAGSQAQIQYWGAPPGENWIVITADDAPTSVFLTRTPVPGRSGAVTIRVPETPNELEVHFTHDIGSGVHQLLGQLDFTSGHRRVSLEAPDRVENRTPMTFGWEADELPGDHVTLALSEAPSFESVFCLPADAEGAISATAPEIPGEYIVRYVSPRGRTLAQSSLEVFEILATLDAPREMAPGADIAVRWTGPDAEQDFLSVAGPGDADDQYLSFVPTENGNPAHIRAPGSPGEYELRYVRAADGEVLARETFTVATSKISLEVPASVDAGTRFEVAWTGTSEEGDFVALTRVRTGIEEHLDFAFTNLGSPTTLAAPFQPGRYVVRYVSGVSGKVLARSPIDIR
jgi:Ca-activated chloride channel family protein